MSQEASRDATPDSLDDLPSRPVGTLDEPEIVDSSDEDAIRQAAEATIDDDSPQGRTGARTQQGRMKADVVVAKARIDRSMAREALTDERINERVQRFLRTEADGFLQVTRLGPVEMPSIELGVIGQIRHEQLSAMTIAQVLSGMVGGGLFQISAYRGDNSPVEGDVYTIQVVGDPKPKTRAGKAWLAKVSREGALDEPAPRGDSDETKSMMQLIFGMMERDKERDRIRAQADEDRRRAEADERAREWRARQEEAKTDRQKELDEIKAQREKEREDARAQRDRDLAEFRARQEQEAVSAKARLDAQIEDMKLSSAARLEQMKLDAEIERDRRKVLLDAEARRIESKDTGGLGFEGIGKIREMVAEAVGKAALKSAGVEDEDEESSGIGGALADVLRQEGPELIQKAASIFLPKLANWIPGGSSAPAPQIEQTPAPQRLPPPAGGVPDFSTPSGPPPAPNDVMEPESDVPTPQPAQSMQPQEIVAKKKQAAGMAAGSYALTSVLGFVQPLTVLALARPDARAAWGAPIGPDRTLYDAFLAMPADARKTAAEQWPQFLAAVKEASPTDADVFADAVARDGGDAWLAEFLAAGPWIEEQEEAA